MTDDPKASWAVVTALASALCAVASCAVTSRFCMNSTSHHRACFQPASRTTPTDSKPNVRWNATLGSFGPPAYGAAQVAMAAIAKACAKDGGVLKSRKDVISQVKHVVIKNWILGGTFRFSTKTNDPLNGKFTIFQIQSDGKYKVVA